MSKIDETIEKMKGFILDIEEETIKHTEKLSEDGKAQAKEFADRTIQTINNSIEKLKNMKETVSDENDLTDFLNRLESKCKDVTDFTKTKIDEIKPVVQDNLKDIKQDLEKDFDDFKEELKKESSTIKNDAKSSFDKLLENENVKAAIKYANKAKDKAIEFYNDPKTQEAINKAKLKTIELAELGLDKLKELLQREDEKKDN